MLENFETVQEKVKKVRIEAQHRKDEKKRAAKAEQAIHSREAAKDAAHRDKEKRQQIQKDQRERAKQRIQEKLMQEKMVAEQAKAKQREKEMISMNRKQKEEFRIKEIRRKGEDKMILKDMGYRVIPLELYTTADEQAKLANLKQLDLSGNKLVELPESNFLFNLNALRYLNLSHNRLMYVPTEISNCGNLEVWLFDNNDLRAIPKEIQYMHEMIHWDISRNRIALIPQEIENMYVHDGRHASERARRCPLSRQPGAARARITWIWPRNTISERARRCLRARSRGLGSHGFGPGTR
jgi:hypothetical protein